MSSTIKKKQKNKQRFWTNTHTPWTRFHSARSVCVCACLLLLLFFPFFRCVRFTLSISLSVFFPLSLSLCESRAGLAHTSIYHCFGWLPFSLYHIICVWVLLGLFHRHGTSCPITQSHYSFFFFLLFFLVSSLSLSSSSSHLSHY